MLDLWKPDIKNKDKILEAYDYGMFPFMFPYSAMVFIDSYLTGQFHELKDRNLNYISDTLTQIPLLEIPLEVTRKNLVANDHNNSLHYQHKGLFHTGSWHESSSTIIDQSPKSSFISFLNELPLNSFGKTAIVQPVQTPSSDKDFKLLKISNGIVPIDMSHVISTGLWRENLESPLADWSIGWIDPIGAHTDYLKDQIFYLIYRLAEQPGKEDSR